MAGEPSGPPSVLAQAPVVPTERPRTAMLTVEEASPGLYLCSLLFGVWGG